MRFARSLVKYSRILSRRRPDLELAAQRLKVLKRHLAPQTLQRLLTNELAPAEEEGKGKKVRLPGRWFKGKAGKDESNEK